MTLLFQVPTHGPSLLGAGCGKVAAACLKLRE